MPTIEELFKSKKLASGQTAEQQYDIRNTADLRRNPYNVLMTPSFRIAEIGRRNLSSKTRETKLEAEVTGLKILATTTSPFIYGTDIIKFTTKTRGIVDDMKGGAGGVSNGGILGTFLNKAENFGTNLLSKLGIKLPQQLIPSRIVLDKDFIREGGEYNTMLTLRNLKLQSGGNLLGNLLGGLSGRPNENQIIGSALELGKKKLNNLLLGSPSQAAVNFAKAGGVLYDSISPYGKVMNSAFYLTEDLIDLRKDLSSKYAEYEVDIFNLPLPITNYIAVPNVIKNKKSKFSSNPEKLSDSIEVKRGMYTKLDYLNKMVAYPSKDGLKNDLIKETEKQLDDYDFVALKFWSVYKKAAVNFRAIINGLSETLSPNWDPNKFIGNPFNFYTYNSIERTLTFNFKVYSLSYDEHKSAWQRLNFLTSLAYPQGYPGNTGVGAPFIKFTLGDMFRNKEAFIESLTYTIDENTPWDIGIDEETKNWKLPKIISVDITLKLIENKFSTFQRRLYGYGGVDTNVDIEEDRNKELNRDGSPKSKEAGQKQDVKKETKKDGKPAENPSTEKPKEAKDPRGEFVEEYKGYKIFLKQNLPNFYMESRLGDGGVAFKGPESRSATKAELTAYQKKVIDESGADFIKQKVGADVKALVTSPL
jgi:hypothetical protein